MVANILTGLRLRPRPATNKGWGKKKLTKLRRSFCLISLATNMLEDWDLFHLKSGINSPVWSTKIFLYHIRKLRYKQIKMEYQILNISNIEIWCSILLFWFAYISAPWYRTEMFLYCRQSYASHLLNELCSSLLACL